MTDRPEFLGIISLPYETTTSFLRGTRWGPDAILNELQIMDDFDFLLGKEPLRNIKRKIIRAHDEHLVRPEVQIDIARRATLDILAQGGFPLSLGGEHTVSLGPIRACLERGELGVVQIDAHADLRNSYEGSRYSHACVMRRARDLGCKVMGVGIRTMCAEEAAVVARDPNVFQVDGRRAAQSRDWYALLDKMPQRVYLTIDMDGFDPQEVPSVGTPEPGGPTWYHVIDFIFHLMKTKTVVGADIVELMPTVPFRASTRLAARLTQLVAGLAVAT